MTSQQLKAKAIEQHAAYQAATTETERYAASLRFSSYVREMLKAKKEGR